MTAWAEYDTALAEPPPAERRAVSALLFIADPSHGGHYPTDLLLDIDRYWQGWGAREHHAPPTGLAAAAVGGFVLGKTDEGGDDFTPPPPDATTDAELVRAFVAGFLLCFALVVLGVALVSLRAL